MGRRPSGRRLGLHRRDHEGDGDGQPEQDAEDPRTPRRAIDRTERLFRMGVVVVPVLVAVVVGRVMGDAAWVAGRIPGVLILCHVLTSGPDCGRPQAYLNEPVHSGSCRLPSPRMSSMAGSWQACAA